MLFASVIQHSKQNLMNSKNIATIFSQHFFLAKEIKLEKLCDSLETITACLEFMIDNAVEIFVPPPQLIRDANIYLQKREQSIREQLMTNGKGDWKNLVSTTNLQAIPCVKFCATGATSYKAKDYTEQHVSKTLSADLINLRVKFSAGRTVRSDGFDGRITSGEEWKR